MTRSSQFGVLVLAIAALLTAGCSGQTGAVFQALLDPPPAASGEGSSDGATASETPTWWAHPHGYAMSLPTGWVALDLEVSSTERLLSVLEDIHPGATERVREVLATTGARGSMLAVDLGSDRDVPPLMLVLAEDAAGIRPRQLKVLIADQVAALPGLRGLPVRTDERRNAAASVRFDYTIDDPELGALRIRSSLYRYGGQAYVVSFIAPESDFDAARSDFETIAASLRFGI
jgi:hypothetical protein